VAQDLDFQFFRTALEKRREDIFRLRNRLADSWKTLQEGEVEFEETASKAQMSLGLEGLDDQQRKEIEAIDMALRRIETGEYEICQSCRYSISKRRLKAIPWTPFCTRCASEQETGSAGASTSGITKTELPMDYAGLSDIELEKTIHEKLRNDGRVELEELVIDVDDGVVRLEGALPSEISHEILLEILQDDMGLDEIEDSLRIERQLWQRTDREPPPYLKKTEDEGLLQGEDTNEEVFHSYKSGKPVSPPDRLMPEKEET